MLTNEEKARIIKNSEDKSIPFFKKEEKAQILTKEMCKDKYFANPKPNPALEDWTNKSLLK